MNKPEKTILLLEDEKIIALSESITLKNSGYKVITVETGENAIDIVNQNGSINMILIDIDLGKGMDGIDAAQEILKNHDIPVVFLSSHTEPEFINKIDKITSYGYILKGSAETVLIASVKMAFKLHEANLELHRSKKELEAHQEDLKLQNEELMHAKKQIEIATERYIEFYDFAPLGYVTLSVECIIEKINLTGASMICKERSFLINNNFCFFVTENTRNIFNNFFENVFKTKAKETCEVVIARENNSPIYVLIEGIISENENKCFITMMNITNLKLTEIQLRERMKELQAFYNLSEITEREGITFNELYQELTEILPKSWSHPESACARIVVGENEFRSKNFRESAWKQSASISVNGKIVGTLDVGYFENKLEFEEGPFMKEERKLINAIAEQLGRITERKLAEEEIKKLNEDLKQRARELETINKELESFSYSVSHDLRNPLNIIKGFSNFLATGYSDKLDEEGKGYIKTICENTLRMNQIINDILKLSKITRKKIDLKEVNLSVLAESIATDLRNLEPKRNVVFIITPDIIVKADEGLIRAVLDNLIYNAWKYTEKKDKAIIEFGVTQIEGRTTYFVQDNGAGFDMKYSNRLFAPFKRLHDESEFEGMGIGLATVQRIINRHGGKVWAEGKVGEGATFYFWLEFS